VNRYPWYKNRTTEWLRLIETKKVPHAVLISGSQGLGKIELAQQFAQMAMCEDLSASGSCLHCPSCQLIAVGNHTDLISISAEKEIIKVEQIRKLSRDVMLSGSRNQYRVVIIEDAEKMNNASANALLKTLEEPPQQVIIVLTSSELGRLLPTIKSRCVKISLAIPDDNLALSWLKENADVSEDELKFALILANGIPLIAKTIINNQSEKCVNEMLEDLTSILLMQKSPLEISKKWLTQDYLNCLGYVASFFLYLIKKEQENVNMKAMSQVLSTHYKKDREGFYLKILDFVRSLYLFTKRNKTALKEELLLDELLINWQQHFK